MEQATSHPSHIWYVSYGSNLSEDRFMCYIAGGTPVGSKKRNPGCRDKRAPVSIKAVRMPCKLYFAGHARSWGGAPAFVRQDKDSMTLGRMYLVTDEQFNDIVLQENDQMPDGRRIVPASDELRRGNEFELPGNRLYGHLLKIATDDEVLGITFTTARTLAIGVPSEAYLRVIIRGLKEAYPELTNAELTSYLFSTEGIEGKIRNVDLAQWVASS